MKEPRIPQYTAGRYVPGFEEKAFNLFSECFEGRCLDKQVWEWRFDKNPFFKRRITTLWDDEVLVAMTALTPFKISLYGKTVNGAVSGTTMANPAYRGVSIQLFKECVKNNDDIQFVYGFPNGNSFRIATTYSGQHYVGDIAFWTISAQHRSVSGKMHEIHRFKNTHGELFLPLVKQYSFITNRSVEYLNWRYCDYPYKKYKCFEHLNNNDECDGYIVLSTYYDNGSLHLQIVDLISNDDFVFSELINFAINYGKDIQAEIIKLWMSAGYYKPILQDLGFEYGLRPFQMLVWYEDLSIEDSYIMLSDSDVF